MKTLLIIVAIAVSLFSCKFWPDVEDVYFGINISDETVDFEQINFKVYSLQGNQRFALDSMGRGGKIPPFKKQEKYPHSLYNVGLIYTNSIDTIKNGVYEVRLTLRDGKTITKEFGEFEFGKSRRYFPVFVNGDSTITVR